MAGQSVDRRLVLRYMGLASAAASFPGFHRWAFAFAQHPAPAESPREGPKIYQPVFFSPAQFAMVERLADMILPADETPGAKEAGVAEFIDFMLAKRAPVVSREEMRTTQDKLFAGSQMQVRFVIGLGWLDAQSKYQFGVEFLRASTEQQNDLLEELALPAKYKPQTAEGREFFQLMRDYTVAGYYTTRIGLESLGYPGLRMFWDKMPGCSHPDDPEHAHLVVSESANVAQLKQAN
jgi:gluconate 2-dehydrogenase gamma chain